MSFGVCYYAAKYKYELKSVQSFYFGLCKKDARNIFPFLVIKRRKKKDYMF